MVMSLRDMHNNIHITFHTTFIPQRNKLCNATRKESLTRMGAIWWGTRGTCPLTFLDRGTQYAMSLSLFSLRVCIWRGFKTKYDVCHILCKEFIMLDVTHSNVDDETEFGVVSLILIFL